MGPGGVAHVSSFHGPVRIQDGNEQSLGRSISQAPQVWTDGFTSAVEAVTAGAGTVEVFASAESITWLENCAHGLDHTLAIA